MFIPISPRSGTYEGQILLILGHWFFYLHFETTLNMMFSVTYYLASLNAITRYFLSHFFPNKCQSCCLDILVSFDQEKEEKRKVLGIMRDVHEFFIPPQYFISWTLKTDTNLYVGHHTHWSKSVGYREI